MILGGGGSASGPSQTQRAPVAAPWTARGQFEMNLAPYTRVLNGSKDDGDLYWNRVEVSVPTLIWPYRNDALTTTGDLQSLVISYAFTRPATAARGIPDNSLIFPSMARGKCFLWSPGQWWVRVQHTGAKLDFQLPFNCVPIVDPTTLSVFDFDRYPQRAVDTTQTIGPPAGGATKILSVQEILGGVVAVQLQARQSNMQFAWETFNSTDFFRLNVNDVLVFGGSTLPLADLWGASRPASGGDTYTLTKYFQEGAF